MTTSIDVLYPLAARRAGYVTTAQAAEVGVSRQQLSYLARTERAGVAVTTVERTVTDVLARSGEELAWPSSCSPDCSRSTTPKPTEPDTAPGSSPPRPALPHPRRV